MGKLFFIMLASVALCGCTSKSELSVGGGGYEILLPLDYTPSRAYPLLFCLSPVGDGRGYLNSIGDLSRDPGWIIAASNKYKNGLPNQQFVPDVENAISDISVKYNVSMDRIYLCGFSGGGMAAYVSAYMRPGFYAGVISNNGFIHSYIDNSNEFRKAKLKKAVIIAGERDTTVPLDRLLTEDLIVLEGSGVKAKLITFDGGHEIAPVDKYREALLWLSSS
ncbi:MAG: hypothetical protein V1703_00395 [Candidatus Altiarchaeota archaeon]